MPGVASRGRGRRAMNEINMVPFIDVMLVLLIIFMVTAPLITTVIDVPTVGAGKQVPDRVVYVEIARDESITLRLASADDTGAQPRVALRQLGARVKALQGGDAEVPVVISADRQVPYDAVMSTMHELQKSGVKRVALLAKQGERGN